MSTPTPKTPDALAARISVGSGRRQGRWGRAFLTLLILACIVAAGLYAFDRQQIFTGMRFELRIEDASGLKDGSPVQISGVEAGHIANIRFGKSENDPDRMLPILSVLVKRNFAEALRADLSAEVVSPLLLGEPALVIEPGTAKAPALEEGAMVDLAEEEDSDTFDMIAKGIRNFFESEETPDAAAQAQLLEQIDALVTEVQALRERVDRLENTARAEQRDAPAIP